MVNHIELIDVNFKYPNNKIVLKNFNLSIQNSEFVCLLGESGCGKSTVLRLIAGLEKPQSGQVRINNSKVESPMSSTGIVFQNPSLIPWLSVEENLKLGHKLRNENIANHVVEETLKIVGIEDVAKLKPKELSGGMAQRVAIARSLIGGSNPLIMDEPFSALDALTRMRLQNELYQIWKKINNTVLFITHDIDEAIYLADRVLLMNRNLNCVTEIIPIPLQRPRERNSEEYLKLQLKIKNNLFQLIK